MRDSCNGLKETTDVRQHKIHFSRLIVRQPEEQFRKLLAEAGWKLTRIVPTTAVESIIEDVPAQANPIGGPGTATSPRARCRFVSSERFQPRSIAGSLPVMFRIPCQSCSTIQF